MTGRPEFKATKTQREDVRLMKAVGWSNERIAAQIGISRNTLEKHFAMDLEFGADAKRLAVMRNLEAASKKGNASASKQLLTRFDLGQAADQVATRAEPAKDPKLGKKEQQQQAAEQISGKFAPPPPPQTRH